MRWVVSKYFDLFWFVSPNFISVILALLMSAYFPNTPAPFWFWVLFVLLIDVGHVYSTLFRVYFVPSERARFSKLIWAIPIFAWICGAMLYSLDSIYFWRALAYTAVFHFVRQQYGFLAIYQNEPNPFWRCFEKYLLYLTMLHPLLYWHSHAERVFHWFVTDDFLFADLRILSSVLGTLLLTGMVLLATRFLIHIFVLKKFDLWVRFCLIIGTALSWHIGIVMWNNDAVFTITNVVSHGVPYYGLILAMTTKRILHPKITIFFKKIPVLKTFVIFCFIFTTCSFLAYVEEGFWHGLHWRSYLDFFMGFQQLSQLRDQTVLALVIPLLAVPQATHYILDGFIWKLRGPHAFMNKSAP